MSIVKVKFFDSLVDELGFTEVTVQFDGDWTRADLLDHLRKSGPKWRKVFRKMRMPHIGINDGFSTDKTPIHDGDVVYVHKELKFTIVAGLEDDPEFRAYDSISTVQDDEGIEEIPAVVLPEYSMDATGQAPDSWRHELFPESFMASLISCPHEKRFVYARMDADDPDSQLLQDKPSYTKVWSKMNDDLVGALRDGLKYVKITHGDRNQDLKNNIRKWLIGCEWVLAYREDLDNPKATIVELKRLKKEEFDLYD